MIRTDVKLQLVFIEKSEIVKRICKKVNVFLSFKSKSFFVVYLNLRQHRSNNLYLVLILYV